jgi:DNA-binding NarL/FixJ family response regulator
VDPTPTFARGLADGLQAEGFQVEEPESVKAWAVLQPKALLVACLDTEPDLLRWADSVDSIVTVAATSRDEVQALRMASALGCTSVFNRGRPRDFIVRCVVEAAGGHLLLPASILGTIAALIPSDEARLTKADIGVLRSLASGRSVGEAAYDLGYSRRQMYRHLNRIYARLGASNRTQALLLAVREGLILDDDMEDPRGRA